MRKHFLLLFLMALLPLAGWAQATNLSGYAITFPNEDQEYAYFLGDAISVKPAITLKKMLRRLRKLLASSMLFGRRREKLLQISSPLVSMW